MAYTSKILKAGALIPDTLELFLNWDEQTSIKTNLIRLSESNVFNKASRSRVTDILKIFRQRYLANEQLANSLAILVKNKLPPEVLNPILYFFSAYTDDMIRDTVLLFLSARRASGRAHISSDDLIHALREWKVQGKITGDWSESTLTKVAQGLLATLRDFGILQGVVDKSFAPTYLPVEAFAYIAFYLKSINSSGSLLVKNSLWGLFFLTPTEVERLFVEAQQMQLLNYQAAGSIIRIDFPVDTLEEYSYVVFRAATRTP